MSRLVFAVDLDELMRSVEEMARCGEALDVLLEDVRRRVGDLQLTWEGSAADAQAAAQAEWESGFRRMRAALATMRAAARAAHGNYSAAVATNLRMWEQVR